ncbi:J domain-containing protein [Vibrio breoganii]|uniref:J domain-containing protein n=1 Tax=Vibrio breoganii TaxID=553239 RepID=A0ABX1U9I2_9VIBR|nr:J domain-containing protein [Vibrio breoganii]NMO74622.1 J domain-containing protein [Vibrio breoganii]NMR69934.1 J domain-containing protein [Vibrio breoganii]PMG06758.1 hypothetical protein BCV02_03790 [Vibrio breoganii]PML89795.1 hypothetical protein BCT67_07685 [Vibrio breoganii]PMM19064.1 hypothetical protein BCT59_01180 [Vibrio breoganii]
MGTFHQILGTSDASTKLEIKRSYRLLANRLHPDKGSMPSDELFKLTKIAQDKVLAGKGCESYAQLQIIKQYTKECHCSSSISALRYELKARDRLIEEMQQQKCEHHHQLKAVQSQIQHMYGEKNTRVIWGLVFGITIGSALPYLNGFIL